MGFPAAVVALTAIAVCFTALGAGLDGGFGFNPDNSSVTTDCSVAPALFNEATMLTARSGISALYIVSVLLMVIAMCLYFIKVNPKMTKGKVLVTLTVIFALIAPIACTVSTGAWSVNYINLCTPSRTSTLASAGINVGFGAVSVALSLAVLGAVIVKKPLTP